MATPTHRNKPIRNAVHVADGNNQNTNGSASKEDGAVYDNRGMEVKTVKCIDNEGFEDQLTVGFVYPVVFEGENGPQIINDKGQLRYYGTIKFK